jgi:spore maturation protein CgeB
MARFGFSPPTRVFEAAGAGACLITDNWEGVEFFLEPGREILVAEDGADVAAHLDSLSPERAAEIGQGALHRILSMHTYAHRGAQLDELFSDGRPAARRAAAFPSP